MDAQRLSAARDPTGDRIPIIAGGAVLQVTTDAAVQLGNRGDTIVLVDHTGAPIDHAADKAGKVRTGRTICFGR